ncbi:MAG: flagellar export chaperone FliS [Thermaurantiacus tibetensis]|uniref:flagellar export chaperone FliS n=1 Tax=Thermaurantiacus tibetensis TaxID=2759035 RepID=UPI00188F580C|nr:flagellar export chaperone FliS [Thermaurantiacus tibetensis]
MPLPAADQLLRSRPHALEGDRTAALRHYRSVTLEARVAAASPHELVMMLFDRLIALLREARDAAAKAEAVRRVRATERALAIVDGLDSTLDRARGGEVAEALARAYAMLRAQLLDGSPGALASASFAAEEIASAWRAIGRPRA